MNTRFLLRTTQSLSIKLSKPSTTNKFHKMSATAAIQKDANAQHSGLQEDLQIENKSVSQASGVDLTAGQKVLVGSVLDLFEGKATKRKLGLWNDDAVFRDPLTIAEGRKQYEAQWYGLKAAFSEIERLSHQVTSAGNPITMDLKTKYKVKGIGSEQTIESVIEIHTSPDGKITQVADKWNGTIPEGAFTKALRNLNSVVVPAFVSVPKSAEEEESKK